MNRHKYLVRSIFSSGGIGGPALLVVGRYLSTIIGPLVSLLVVRYLGPYEYGLYASAVAITTFFGILPDFGLQQAALEAVGSGQAPLLKILRNQLYLGIVYSAVALGVSCAWVVFGGYELIVVYLVLLVGLEFFQRPLLTTTTVSLQVQGLYARIALWNLAASMAKWTGTLVAMLLGASLYGVAGWPLFLSTIIVLMMVVFEWRRLTTGDSENSVNARRYGLKQLFVRSWRFGLSSAMHQVYHRFDSLLLSLTRDPFEVGAYSVAFRVIQIINSFPGIVFNQVLYPKYFRWFHSSPEKISLYYRMITKWMLATSLVAAVFVCLFSSELLTIIFGSSHLAGGHLLAVMAWSLPGRFVGASAGALLTTGAQIEKKIKLQTILAIISCGLSLTFIPRYGSVAAAALLAITDVTLVIMYERAVRSVHSLDAWGNAWTKSVSWLLLIVGLMGAILSLDNSLGSRIVVGCVVAGLASLYLMITLTAPERGELQRLLSVTIRRYGQHTSA